MDAETAHLQAQINLLQPNEENMGEISKFQAEFEEMETNRLRLKEELAETDREYEILELQLYPQAQIEEQIFKKLLTDTDSRLFKLAVDHADLQQKLADYKEIESHLSKVIENGQEYVSLTLCQKKIC
jgi:chromosome segregation ATPase